MQTKKLIGLTVATLGALALLIGLGVWQLERLQWKEGLIAEIEARSKAPPMDLRQAIAFANAGHDPSYLRVRVEGRFDHAKERHLYGIAEGGEPGWHVITPLATADGDTVLVDRGFVPDKLKDPAARAEGELQGKVAVTGLVRLSESKALFTPDTEPEGNRWFFRDLDGMARSMFGDEAAKLAPFFIEAEPSDVPGGWPLGGQTRLELPNNHLQYALTWFLLALCLVVIYTVYVRASFRDRKP
jgi:surfeit locus 1 family protein